MTLPNNASSSPSPATPFSLWPGQLSQANSFPRTDPPASPTNSRAGYPPRSSHFSLIGVKSWSETVEEPIASTREGKGNSVTVSPTLEELEDSTKGIDHSEGKVVPLSVSCDVVYKLDCKSSSHPVCSTSDNSILPYCQLQKPASRSQRSLQCLFQHFRNFRSD